MGYSEKFNWRQKTIVLYMTDKKPKPNAMYGKVIVMTFRKFRCSTAPKILMGCSEKFNLRQII